MNDDALKQPLLQALIRISDQALDQAHVWLLSDGKPGAS